MWYAPLTIAAVWLKKPTEKEKEIGHIIHVYSICICRRQWQWFFVITYAGIVIWGLQHCHTLARFLLSQSEKKNLESSNKRLGIIFWTVNFSIFSQNIYKNYLISQSNIPLTLIQSIDHTTQTNICLDMIFQETILDVFDGILH